MASSFLKRTQRMNSSIPLAKGSPMAILVVVCSAIAIYNALELLVLVLMTFQRRKGLYFWSITLASFGLIPYSVGWTLVNFKPSVDYIGVTLDIIGWILVVSGQSVVLYSRLHLVLNNTTILRTVLWIIICDAVVWHISITVLLFGSIYSPLPSRNNFNAVYHVMEKVQITFFCVQEFFISSLYIWATVNMLKTASGNKRQIMWKLFGINVLIVLMNIGVLAVVYNNLFIWEQGIKAVIYSIKLKLEFAILNQLVRFVQRHEGINSVSPPDSNIKSGERASEQPHAKNTKIRQVSMPDAIHLEDMSISNAAASAPDLLTRQGDHSNEIRVSTEISVEEESAGSRDCVSMHALYNEAMWQISMPHKAP
ncbi:hypothetical protein N7478_007171 [Penicillium angulare]|uniref:uncharacterized protein n=1 Tax=Penicillium angulare TaxID=116970 RepID=UPI002540D57E|nr:uncharacterized protein N7478_007171 [Penicillium angulare]KAJ5281799.1 hypothetical protein N7478_007171 [Penicillium angulare]